MSRDARNAPRMRVVARASAALAIVTLATAPLAGCVAAPIMDGFLLTPHERVPEHLIPDAPTPEPTEPSESSDSATPTPPSEPGPIATNMPSEDPDGA